MKFTYRGCEVTVLDSRCEIWRLNQSILILPGGCEDAIRFIDDQLEITLGGQISRYD